MLSRSTVQTPDDNEMTRLGRMKTVPLPHTTHVHLILITDRDCCQYTLSAVTMLVLACRLVLMILSSMLPHHAAGMEAASEMQDRYADKVIMHQMICHDAPCYWGGTSSFPTVIKDLSVYNNHEYHLEVLG
jgi:hypothetical protein